MAFPRPACQICGKHNHSARTCHFRNTQTSTFPPPGFSVPSFNPTPGVQHSLMWRYGPSPSSFPRTFQLSMSYSQFPPPAASQHQFVHPSSASGYSGGVGGYTGSVSSPVSCPGVIGSSFPSALAFAASYASGLGVPELHNLPPSQNWYLNSGATNHVTSDLNNIVCP